jgi:co-chaperonin GroES (HSP10)
MGVDIDIDKIRMVGDKVMVMRCFNPDIEDEDGNPLIVMPDIVKEDTNFCEILAVGPKCKAFSEEHVGCIVHVPDNPGRHTYVYLDDKKACIILRESDILPATYDE